MSDHPATRAPLRPSEVIRPVPLPVDADAPSVSVVVPCFNYARYVGQAVDSALTQPGVSVTVIVVDDASTDDSLEVVARIAARDARVRVVSHSTNQGPVRTFNDGLDLIEGEYVVRLDADDLLTPGSLLRSAAVLRACPDVGFVYGHPLHFSGPHPPEARSEVRSWTLWPGRSWLAERCRLGVNCITAPEVMMRAEVVRRVGGQKELAHTHDMEMWMRLAAVADVAHVDGPDQAWHRDHAESLSALEVDIVTDLHERRDAFRVLFEGIGAELPEAEQLDRLARTALAREAIDRVNRAYDRGRSDSRPVAELLEFASSLGIDLESLPEWRGLTARLRWSAKLVPWLPQYALASIRRRRREDTARRRWHRTGI